MGCTTKRCRLSIPRKSRRDMQKDQAVPPKENAHGGQPFVKTRSSTEQITKCPICGSTNGLTSLAKLGLSFEEIRMIEEYVKNGTIRDVLRIAEIALRRLDPEKTGIELQVNNAVAKLRESSTQMAEKFTEGQKQFIHELSEADGQEKERLVKEYEEKQIRLLKEFQKEITERSKTVEQLEKERLHELTELRQGMNEIKQKIVGAGIGEVGEMMTLLDLKKSVPTDSFSETRAARHGTDIAATVKDKGRTCGTVTISVKYQQTWGSDFLRQLEKNMKEDGTRWGILVSRSFPREALSTKAWVTEDESGNTIVLAKPEYAPLAYIGLRQAVIHWFEAKQIMKSKEAEVTEAEKVMGVLANWINGDEFEATVRYVDNARKEAEKTRENLHQVQNYVNTRLSDAAKFQDVIIEHMIHARSLVGGLRELLAVSSPPGNQLTHSAKATNAYNKPRRIAGSMSEGGS